ncbi:type 4a pilus biogenesis protein PilO [Cohnella sp. REN36]|uniref:type 4a pilus biogenesis protein PilO n=1 Tax=Cohnella sp. REN36 TaxID=2887347 RepID=UPI001D14D13E|nr:type 4a pilus biogenesis protein PilO [Cohnella sp. REN36]MCC3374610.1 type 4a pilus biogenesis protein PilO [Cohnella sp. REN36]
MGTMEALTDKRKLIFIAVVLLFLLLLGGYLTFLQPLNASLSDQKDEIDRLNGQIRILTDKAAEKNREAGSFSQADVQAALPLSDNTEQLLLDLQTIGRGADVELLGSTFSTAETNQLQTMFGMKTSPYPSVKELKASVVLQGKYEQLLDWIDRLQRLPRLVSVDAFSLAKPSSEADAQKPITLNLNFTVYYDPSYRNLTDGERLPYQP